MNQNHARRGVQFLAAVFVLTVLLLLPADVRADNDSMETARTIAVNSWNTESIGSAGDRYYKPQL